MRELEFEDFEKLLLISADLDAELIKAGDIIYRVGKKAALALSVRDSAKMEMERVYAEVYMKVRRLPAEKKLTGDEVDAEVKLSQAYCDAQEEYIVAKRLSDEWQALCNGFDKRSFALTSLCNRDNKEQYITGRTSVMDRPARDDRASSVRSEAGALREAGGLQRRKRI